MAELLVVLVCLFLNMLLSGAEMAFVTVRKAQLQRLTPQDKRARLLLQLKANPERTLSVIQIGITLVGAIAAAVGGAGAEEALSPMLAETFALSKNTADAASIAMVVFVPLLKETKFQLLSYQHNLVIAYQNLLDVSSCLFQLGISAT